MNIGEKIRNLRKKFHMTQEELAYRLGYTNKNISKWENNYSVPDYATLKQICKVFLIDFVDLSDIEVIDEDNNKNQIVNISSKAIELFEYMIEANGAISIECSEERLLALEELVYEEVLSTYSTVYKGDNVLIKYVLNPFFNDNKKIYDYFRYKKYKNVNFANDKEYTDFVKELKLPKQTSLVLDVIEALENINFKTNDIYDEKLINKLESLYQKNTDVRKTIRNSLSQLCKLGVIEKNGYDSYTKKHHKVKFDISFKVDDKVLNGILKIDFNKECFESYYSFSDFENVIANKRNVVQNIYDYLIRMRNLLLVKDFLIKFKNEYQTLNFLSSEHIIYEDLENDFKLIVFC